MARICFPHYKRGEFSSLNEAFRYLRKINYGWSWFTLTEIVKCNVGYRDCLRDSGIDSLVKKITDEVPELADDTDALNHLREWATREKVAMYDIQCYNIKDEVTILGHTFYGLDDIINHRELIGERFMQRLDCMVPKDADGYPDIHIGALCEDYPVFDSYDLGDDRSYQNYIFRKNEITKEELETVYAVYHGVNFCMVHEQIPSDLLPILYYNGDGNYMLLATNK